MAAQRWGPVGRCTRIVFAAAGLRDACCGLAPPHGMVAARRRPVGCSAGTFRVEGGPRVQSLPRFEGFSPCLLHQQGVCRAGSCSRVARLRGRRAPRRGWECRRLYTEAACWHGARWRYATPRMPRGRSQVTAERRGCALPGVVSCDALLRRQRIATPRMPRSCSQLGRRVGAERCSCTLPGVIGPDALRRRWHARAVLPLAASRRAKVWPIATCVAATEACAAGELQPSRRMRRAWLRLHAAPMRRWWRLQCSRPPAVFERLGTHRPLVGTSLRRRLQLHR
mmetsp:Transcript_12548/g.36677  ORF Transcript_12548/g.36677 Transcript_12548/m.36677 type:complete len:282 (-) Transcript_12548:370-1215(-)